MLKPETLAMGSHRKDGKGTKIPVYLLSRSLGLIEPEESTQLLCLERHKEMPTHPRENTGRPKKHINSALGL